MSTKPLKTRSVLKRLGIALALLMVVLGGIHLFLYYKANTLFKAFVEQISGGEYTATTQKLRFAYLPFRIKAVDVHFFPLDSTAMDRRYHVRADSIQLHMTSLAPLLLYNALEVREVRLVRPYVLVNSDSAEKAGRREGFNIPLKEIQDGLLKSLDLLEVDRCVIVDGGFRVVRKKEGNHLAINHIDLTIDSLLAARGNMLETGTDSLGAHIRLRVVKPDIEIPDTNYTVQVDMLQVDTRRNLFNIDELRFARNKERDAYDTIKLSTINLRGLNWQQFLKRGVIVLDSVRVKNGLAQIDLTDRFLFQRAMQKNVAQRIRVDVPMEIRYLLVQEVQYKLKSRRKTGRFTIQLDGDNLVAESFSLLDTVPSPLGLGSLSLNVRNYYDQDDRKTYLAGFDRLTIRNKVLDIKNYRIIPLRQKGFSANNRIDVPSLTLYGYSLPELLRGRLAAERLELNEPRIIIDILSGRTDSAKGAEIARPVFEALNRLQPSLDIATLLINNARVTLQPRTNLADTILISQLSTEINMEKLLGATSIADLMQVTEGIRSNGFYITGARFDFKVEDALISPVTNTLTFGRLQGQLESGLLLDLDSVLVRARPGELLVPVEGKLNLEKVDIGKGAVMVTAGLSGGGAAGRKKAPVLQIDSLNTGPLQLTYVSKTGAASTVGRLALQVNGLHVNQDDVHWVDLIAAGSGLRTGLGNTNFAAATWSGQFPGTFSLSNVKLWPSMREKFGVTVNIPSATIKTKFNRLKWDADAVEWLVLNDPQVRWNIGAQETEAGTLSKVQPLRIPHITVHNPDLDGYRLTTAGEKRHVRIRGGLVDMKGLDLFAGAPETISLQSVSAHLPQPLVQVDSNWTLSPARVRLLGNNLVWQRKKGITGTIDTAWAEGIGQIPVFRDSLQQLTIGVAGISQWDFPTPTDSFLQKLAYGPDWWVSGATYRYQNATGNLEIANLSARRLDRSIAFDSLIWKPALSRDSFWRSLAMEKDYITLRMGAGKAINVTPADGKTKGLHIPYLMLHDLRMEASRDRALPDDTVSYRPLMAAQLQQLPLWVVIDSVQVKDASVRYMEKHAKTGIAGTLDLDRLNGFLYGINSRAEGTTDSLLWDVQGRLFGAAPIRLRFAQAYADTLQAFRFSLQGGQWPMSAANSLLGPVNDLRFRRGQADTLWLEGWGNRQFAYGWMGFTYRRMQVALLKDGSERYFLSGPYNAFANLVVHNNNRGLATPFFTRRNQGKATFNLWGKMLSSGLMGNVGLPGKKKRATKAMRKENLPTQLPRP